MDYSPMIADAVQNADLNGTCAPRQTAIPSLTIYCARRPSELMPALFEPRFYLLLQGSKRMSIAGRDFIMRPGDCAISSLGLPFHTAVAEASSETPYLGIAFAINPKLVTDMLLAHPDSVEKNGSAFSSGKVTDDVASTIARLLALTRSPNEIPVLSPLLERELTYRLSFGTMGGTLRKAVLGHSGFEQIRAAVEWIRTHVDQPMSVKSLARQVGMSVTSFHRHFRTVTSTSPLAYQRHLRLLAAREQLLAQSHSVTTVAFASGYASASQFSREYKEMFGVTPRSHRQLHARSDV